MPKNQLLWMSGGQTVGSTHYDPHENLMAVISGSKTFHLAHPDQGKLVGGFTPMIEAHLELSSDLTAVERSNERLASTATDLHHYAAASLSRPAEEQRHLPAFENATVFSCTAVAGEVLYVPAYWWHEVESQADAETGLSIGINWFYENYYQRIFHNMSWDRSPHYLLTGEQRSLRRPFPMHSPEAPQVDPASVSRAETQPARPGRGGSRFSSRLRDRRSHGRSETDRGHNVVEDAREL